jgi:hypothetical protein
MRRGRELRHVATGLGDDDLRHLRPHPRDGLQQLDLMRPRLTGGLDRAVDLRQRQPTEPRGQQAEDKEDPTSR